MKALILFSKKVQVGVKLNTSASRSWSVGCQYAVSGIGSSRESHQPLRGGQMVVVLREAGEGTAGPAGERCLVLGIPHLAALVRVVLSWHWCHLVDFPGSALCLDLQIESYGGLRVVGEHADK